MRTLRGPEEGQAKEMQGVLEDGFLVKVMFNSGFEGWVRREREGVSCILQCENQVTSVNNHDKFGKPSTKMQYILCTCMMYMGS
jgi:hypothetical protein